MKLEDFLFLIQDEEARIELEIDDPSEDEYPYSNFWLSDYRTNDDIAVMYFNYKVVGFGFITNEKESDITIKIIR